MHHRPVKTHGAPKIEMDSGEREYQARLKSARLADNNPFVSGANELGELVGNDIKDTRTELGAVRAMPQDVIGGPESNFKHMPTTSNIPKGNVLGTTGSLELGTSGTKSAQDDPKDFQTDALADKIGMYTRAISNAGYSLNDRANSGSLG